MKSIAAVTLLLCALAVSAFAQLPHFEHIIYIIQENRTPDNLFGGNPTFEPGVDLQQGSSGPWCLGACFSPRHSHDAWTTMWNNGGPNWHNGENACQISINNYCFVDTQGTPRVTRCNGQIVSPSGTLPLPGCLPKTYVSTTYDTGKVAPYFEIAQKYGFANYFFQTNQGPSFPAHQFLFSGTSAPTGTIDPIHGQHRNFASENPTDANHNSGAGCNSPDRFKVKLIGPDGQENITPIHPCFQDNSLAGLLDQNGKSWRYYASSDTHWDTNIWNAPNAVAPICKPLLIGGGGCNGYDWLNYVFHDTGKILQDISTCNLQKVSWVIPNDPWSDHPGFQGTEDDSNDIEGGPAWVANIVNAIGNSWAQSNGGGQCDYWGHDGTADKKEPTAIFILWDDWGGWWDHVNPESAPNLPVLLNIPNCSAWGCGYAYGFRVPLLVVSAFTPSGYVSGDTRTPGGGEQAPYIHDFGSLLAFTENNFLGVNGIGQINPQYQFADFHAPERQATPPTIPLADFFPQPQNQPLPFQQINIPDGTGPGHFINYTGPLGDPDNDAVDND